MCFLCPIFEVHPHQPHGYTFAYPCNFTHSFYFRTPQYPHGYTFTYPCVFSFAPLLKLSPPSARVGFCRPVSFFIPTFTMAFSTTARVGKNRLASLWGRASLITTPQSARVGFCIPVLLFAPLFFTLAISTTAREGKNLLASLWRRASLITTPPTARVYFCLPACFLCLFFEVHPHQPLG